MRGGIDLSEGRNLKPAMFRAAETTAGLGWWRWSRGARTVALSAGLARMLGLGKRAQTVPARPLLRRMTATHRGALLATLRRKGPKQVEAAVADLQRQSRSIFTVQVHCDGRAHWGVAHDITALRAAISALEQTEGRWESVLEQAGHGMWDSNLVTGETYHSRAWRVMRGMDPDGDARATHGNWLERIHPDDVARIQELAERQGAGEIELLTFEYRERLPDGRDIWVSSTGRIVERDAQGRALRVVGTDTDITERKKAEAEMERLSRRLKLALEVAEIGIFEVNLATLEYFWDKRNRTIYGIAEDYEITVNLWESLLHPEDRDRALTRVWDAIGKQEPYQSEFRIVRPDGETRHIRTVGTWYRDSDGIPKLLGVNSDVTEDVLAKQNLERARALAEARNAELEATRAAIEYNALHDALTGLPNRRYLDDHLAERARRVVGTGEAVSLLHVDLDLFKQINDTLGHQAGDAMLRHVADLLRSTVGPDAFVARVGGDEFSVICSLAPSDPLLAALAAEIIARIRQPVPYEGHFCRFGASIGIASQAGADADPKRLPVDADIALYRAKRRGRDRFEFFTETLQAETTRLKKLADEIMVGIEQNAFIPFYQPLFDARTMEIAGVEALARWQHPTRGILAPTEFLNVADDLNVVTAIDRAILETGLDRFNRWRAEGLDLPSISVNVSFRRLHDEELIEHLRGLRFEPGTLSFELLESIFLDDLDDLASFNLDQIRDLGIDISVDDFGTGHASIVGLLKIRPRRFKLDRAFLDGLTTSVPQRRLVGSIVEIGRSLGIKVVAEGVEQPEQVHLLRELGCDLLQGYVFARPMPAEAFEDYLRNRSWRQVS